MLEIYVQDTTLTLKPTLILMIPLEEEVSRCLWSYDDIVYKELKELSSKNFIPTKAYSVINPHQQYIILRNQSINDEIKAITFKLISILNKNTGLESMLLMSLIELLKVNLVK